MKELYCTTLLVSCSCIANLNITNNNIVRRFLIVDDKGMILYPSLSDNIHNNINLRQYIPYIPSSLKITGIYSIDDTIILSTGMLFLQLS